MKILNKMKFVLVLLLILLTQLIFINPREVFAASSPTLGQAASFAVLAGTTITDVPTSVITGDVGLSPAAGSNITGLTSAEVSGTIFAVDSTGPDGTTGNNPTLVNQAKVDLVTAYDALSAAPNATCDTTYPGTKDLVGESLVAGIYCADAFELSGTLTLSGPGVWIFRSAATLITSGTANIVGGNACDVWWKVVSSATLGTNTSLKGNILALTSITMNTGATLTGRALARNGAVTLDSNTINQSCSAPVSLTSSSSSSSSSSAPVAPYCPPIDSQIVAPSIIDSRRVDADSIYISWAPYSGTDQFNVQYGTEDGKWLYNVDVTGFSTTINALPLNQPIWVRVAARNDCRIGTYGESRFVGGPGLPNTGSAPRGNNIPWYIFTGISLLLSPYLLKRVFK